MYTYVYIYTYYIYIYICMVTPPTTRTPLKNTVNTDTNAIFPNPILELFLQIENKCKTQKIQKTKKKQDSVDVKSFGFLDFSNVGMLDFWMLVDICTPGTAFPCTVGARVRSYYHPYMGYMCIHMYTG